uniref:Peptidase S1 domain-containing protein n=1 Tax=Timema bartmani TaxID=61472 RepID=A0A7R9EP53_9NEOP|nr:unnamed protein product [Timema bartmani]
METLLPELITIVEDQVTRRTLDERLFGRTSGIRSSFTKEGVSQGEQAFEILVFKKAKSKKRPKIVGGEPATVKEFTFIVAVNDTISKNFFCGGSIISEKYALTAAHCTDGYFPEDVTLRVGSPNWTNGGVEHTVRRLINHEDHVYSINDIALMEVKKTFQFNSKVQPIAIYPHVYVPDGSKVTLMGWGRTNTSIVTGSSVLMKVELEVWPLDECKKFWEKYSPAVKITDKTICAGCRDKKGGGCQGDSGGPLIFKGKLIGIVSGGIDDCGAKNTPEGFYTRVAAYKDWIDSHTVRRRKRKGSRSTDDILMEQLCKDRKITKKQGFEPWSFSSTRKLLIERSEISLSVP